MMFLFGNISLPPTTGLFIPASAEVIVNVRRAMMVTSLLFILKSFPRRRVCQSPGVHNRATIRLEDCFRGFRQSDWTRIAYSDDGGSGQNAAQIWHCREVRNPTGC